MNAPDPRQHLTDRLAELGVRYLRRTSGEVVQLRTCLAQVLSGDVNEWTTIAQLAHRIRGSGGMFGFEAVSDAAGAIEVALRDMATVDAVYISQLIDALETQVQSASKAAGIAP
jgi:HPt (histidine-containing phosphotransfer) domain-containing protein